MILPREFVEGARAHALGERRGIERPQWLQVRIRSKEAHLLFVRAQVVLRLLGEHKFGA